MSEAPFSPPTGAIGAVVVNHNGGARLSKCLMSLAAAGVGDVVVVDNASTDGSLDRIASLALRVEILRTGGNPGYGTAANRGVRRLANEYALICNPDLVVDEHAPQRLAAVLDADAGTAVVGPRINETDGSTYPSARSFPTPRDALGHALFGMFFPQNRWSKRYRDRDVRHGRDHDVRSDDQAAAVDWVSGACMLVRREAFLSVGGFDEGYFMYVEDLDLCWRLRRVGWTTRYAYGALVVHERGGSSKEHPYRLVVADHESTWRFARKSMTGQQRLLLPLVGLGILARLGVAFAKTHRSIVRSRRIRAQSEVG